MVHVGGEDDRIMRPVLGDGDQGVGFRIILRRLAALRSPSSETADVSSPLVHGHSQFDEFSGSVDGILFARLQTANSAF